MTPAVPTHYLSLLEIGELIRTRELSSVAVTELLLERIQTSDARLHSYLHVMAERALEEARRADREIGRGEVRGPLHGVPVGVKDIFAIDGEPMTAGMPLRQGSRAAGNATVITRLATAGAVLLGTQTLPEGVYAEHVPPFTAPLNPWNESTWSGASSSGSAVAVAAGLCYGSVGS